MWKTLSNQSKEIKKKLLITFYSLKNGRKKKKCINILFPTIKEHEINNTQSSEIIHFSFTEKNSYMNLLV